MDDINKSLLDNDDFIKKKRNHPISNSILLGLGLFYFFITYIISGLTNINLYTTIRTQWIYSEVIYFIFIILLWLSSPYIISRFREKIVMLACGILFLVVCFFRVFIPSVMVFPMILLSIATMLVWSSAGSYLFLLNNPIKEYNVPGISFGIFFGLKGLHYLFTHLESRTSIIISFIVFNLIGLVLIYLLVDPSKEFEKEHHDIRDIKEAILSPINYLKDHKEFIIAIPVMLYLGYSSVAIDASVYGGNAVLLYSIIFSGSAFGFGYLYDKNYFNKPLLVASLSIAAVILSILYVVNFILDIHGKLVLSYFIAIIIAFINGGLYTLLYLIVNSTTTIFKTVSAATNIIFIIQCGSFIGFIFYSWNSLFSFILIIFLFGGLLSILYIFKFNLNQLQNNDNNNNYNNGSNDINHNNNNYNNNNNDDQFINQNNNDFNHHDINQII